MSNFVNSYVPSSFFREGKEALAGRECRESFGIVDISRNDVAVAARGPLLAVGKKLGLSGRERNWMKQMLLSHRCAAVLSGSGVLLAFPDLLQVTGLMPVLLPNGSAEKIASSLRLLSEQLSVCMSPELTATATRGGASEEYCAMLTEQITSCDAILRPQEDVDFRHHCAQIARFAGCRVNVTELPVGPLSLADTDRMRWTAFLLCTFLALRGDSAAGPELQMPDRQNDFHLRLLHTPERFGSEPLKDARFQYLKLPCFSDFLLEKNGNGWMLEVTLRRKQYSRLHAASAAGDRICIYIERTA